MAGIIAESRWPHPFPADLGILAGMASLVLSTVAFFVASFFVKRWLEGMGIEKTMTRTVMILVAASAVSYAVAVAVDWVSP